MFKHVMRVVDSKFPIKFYKGFDNLAITKLSCHGLKMLSNDMTFFMFQSQPVMTHDALRKIPANPHSI